MAGFGIEMRIGRLRHRLELQEKSVTGRDSFGAEQITWVTKQIVWGSIEPLSGNEYFAAKQTQAAISHRVKIRYNSAINTKWRIKFGTRIFEIESIINRNERNEEQTLICSESV